MFFGSYEYSLDDKGRLTIPSKFRDEISKSLYHLKGFDGCLSVYPESEFQNYISRLTSLEFEKEKVRLHQRILLSSVVELKVDNANRVLIPSKTLKQYGINKDVIIVGVLDHFEIWDNEKWKKYQEMNESSFELDAEAILKNEE